MVVVHGPSTLKGTKVEAHDLRTGDRADPRRARRGRRDGVAPGYLIDRGHADIAGRLTALGADLTWRRAADQAVPGRRLAAARPGRACPAGRPHFTRN